MSLFLDNSRWIAIVWRGSNPQNFSQMPRVATEKAFQTGEQCHRATDFSGYVTSNRAGNTDGIFALRSRGTYSDYLNTATRCLYDCAMLRVPEEYLESKFACRTKYITIFDFSRFREGKKFHMERN